MPLAPNYVWIAQVFVSFALLYALVVLHIAKKFVNYALRLAKPAPQNALNTAHIAKRVPKPVKDAPKPVANVVKALSNKLLSFITWSFAIAKLQVLFLTNGKRI